MYVCQTNFCDSLKRSGSTDRFVLQSDITDCCAGLPSNAAAAYVKYRFGRDNGFKRHFVLTACFCALTLPGEQLNTNNQCCGQLSILKHGSELQADVWRLFPNQYRGTTHTSTRGKCAIHSLHLAACNERNANLPGK